MPKEEQIYWESLQQYPAVVKVIKVAAASLESLEEVKEAVQVSLEEAAASLEVPDQLSMRTMHRQANDEIKSIPIEASSSSPQLQAKALSGVLPEA